MKLILRKYDKNISNLIRWISYGTVKLTEFLFKQSVSLKVFVRRNPIEIKKHI